MVRVSLAVEEKEPNALEVRLGEHLAKIGTAPFLFIGSGISRRYVNLETWEQLLRRFAAGLPQPFEYYYGLADRDLAQTASLLAAAYYEKWWSEPAFDESRKAFKEQVSSKSSCLKYEIAQYLKKQRYAPGTDTVVDGEIELLKKATVDGVITTNWDTILETIFPEFEVYIGQDQILFSVSQGIAEIYKIHGCCTEPNSLTLTTEDYHEFNERNPYLAAKLLTIFVEHPVIFLGYSLSDPNITSILRQIASCLTNENIHKLKDRLLFVEYDAESKGDSFEASVTQVGGHSIPVHIIRTKDFSHIYRPLSLLKRRFSARLLRQMKEHLYELVKANDPQEKLGVVDIDEGELFRQLEVVYGIGVVSKVGRLGYAPITRVELLKDIMAPVSHYDAAAILKETLPGLVRNTEFSPVFRYLRNAGLIGTDGTIECSKLDAKVTKVTRHTRESFFPPGGYRNKILKAEKPPASVKEVIEMFGDNAYLYIPFLEVEQIKPDELKNYILANLQLITSKQVQYQTYFRRLICFYDWLVYGAKPCT